MGDMLFSNMTLKLKALPCDAPFSTTGAGWGWPMIRSLGPCDLMKRISVEDTTIAHRGLTEVRFPAPLLAADSIRMPS